MVFERLNPFATMEDYTNLADIDESPTPDVSSGKGKGKTKTKSKRRLGSLRGKGKDVNRLMFRESTTEIDEYFATSESLEGLDNADIHPETIMSARDASPDGSSGSFDSHNEFNDPENTFETEYERLLREETGNIFKEDNPQGDGLLMDWERDSDGNPVRQNC